MAEATEQPSGGSKKTIIVFAAIVLLAVAGSIGGTLYFMAGETEADSAQAAPVEAPTTAIYHNLRPAFVVNFQTGNKPRYLQADLTVMARNPAVVEALINHTPLVRSRIIAYLADLDFYELQSHEGKQAMREGLLELLNRVLREEAQTDGIQTVLLNNFVMQ
jgi:flagellar FliL protein